MLYLVFVFPDIAKLYTLNEVITSSYINVIPIDSFLMLEK